MRKSFFLTTLTFFSIIFSGMGQNELTETLQSSFYSLFSALVQAFSSTIVSELGDKTFFIAAIMAMRYNRIAVLSGALLALFLMTGISTAFGSIVPTILPSSFTHFLITFLFFFFGAKLLYEAYTNDGEDRKEETEIEIELNEMHAKLIMKSAIVTFQLTDKLEEKEHISIKKPQRIQEEIMSKSSESYPLSSDEDSHQSNTQQQNDMPQPNQVANKLVFWQAFTMTFLAEWGGRSQISTIALAANGGSVLVFTGAFLGHMLCSFLAVIGGQVLAKKISEKTVNIYGGILFCLFGAHNLFFKSSEL